MPNGISRSRASIRSFGFASRVLRLAVTMTLGIVFSTAVHAARQVPVETGPSQALFHITLRVDGGVRTVVTGPTNAGDLLTAQDVRLGDQDRCSAPLKSSVSAGGTVTVTRVRSDVSVERTPIPFPVKQTYTSTMSIRNKTVVQHGIAGERVARIRCTYKDNIPTTRERISESVTLPRTQIEIVGTRGMTLASRGYFGGRRVIEMVATGYGPNGNGRWGAQTASGLRPGFGVVAVDPRFIPLGTRLYIDGYGYAVAGDTGGAIKGNRIDLGRDTNYEAMLEGRKKVRVLILN